MILALVETNQDGLSQTSREMFTPARELADALGVPLEAILIGADARASAPDLAAGGVTRVHRVQHERLDRYAPGAWAQSIVHLIGLLRPEAVLAAGTDRGNEVMAHTAARLDRPLAANCTEIHPGDPYRITRVRWGGSLLEEAYLHGEPKLLTVAPHTFPVEDAPRAGELAWNAVTPVLEDKDFRVQVTERVEAAGDKVSLVDARVVVGGGRGVGSREGFACLEELAELLGGAVGCSRAVTNEGWRPHADQIGQTGTRIAPDIYIACGISGAIQHIVGCKGSKHILAVNTDPEAPILARADYAVIGDLHEVIPALSAAIRRLQNG